MVIMCPAEFAEAATFAAAADEALDAAILEARAAGDEKTVNELEPKRGQGCRTLLLCLGNRARSDKLANENPHFLAGSEVKYKNGTTRTILDISPYGRPRRETVIYLDMARYSFFFAERWIDPTTETECEIYDRCWYLFNDGSSQGAVNMMTDEDCEKALEDPDGKVGRTFSPDKAATAASKNIPIRETMFRRRGMCGGIIFHKDYRNGEGQLYGSWTTHT